MNSTCSAESDNRGLLQGKRGRLSGPSFGGYMLLCKEGDDKCNQESDTSVSMMVQVLRVVFSSMPTTFYHLFHSAISVSQKIPT